MKADMPFFSVLLVDNNKEDLLPFKRSLEENSQLPTRIDMAFTIDEAMLKVRKQLYHLLLVEEKLKKEQGLKLLDMMEEEGIKMPFVLMTPIRDDKLVREMIKRGVADVIVKSESQFSELANRLQETYSKFYGLRTFELVEDRFKNPEAPQSETFEENSRDTPFAQAETSFRDELTGVFTHGYMHDRIVREFSRASRYGYPISCIMVDIDHFKEINEKFSYRVGDELLRECAQLIFDKCRLADVIARYSGTEFIVLLPHISYEGAFQLAKRLRLAFSEREFTAAENLNVTVSIGVSSFPEDSMTRRSDLIAFAKRALLRSKATGRNRCTLFREMEPVIVTPLPKLEISEEKIALFQRGISEVAERARRDYLDIARQLINTLENKDRCTAGHSSMTAKYARHVADALGFSNEEAEIIESGTLLHDIGKICIPDEILLKPAKLTMPEFELMKQHAYYGYKILSSIKFLKEEALIVLHHHEWFNGEGYPCHLKGPEIPIGARIASVIDAFDTMRGAGARYKKTTTVGDAVQELIDLAGVQFDPQVVKVFIDVLLSRREINPGEFDASRLDDELRRAA